MLGTGSGFTQLNQAYKATYAFLERVTATDKYTCQVKFTSPSALNLLNLSSSCQVSTLKCRESVEKGWGVPLPTAGCGWHGPWILSDFRAWKCNKTTFVILITGFR